MMSEDDLLFFNCASFISLKAVSGHVVDPLKSPECAVSGNGGHHPASIWRDRHNLETGSCTAEGSCRKAESHRHLCPQACHISPVQTARQAPDGGSVLPLCRPGCTAAPGPCLQPPSMRCQCRGDCQHHSVCLANSSASLSNASSPGLRSGASQPAPD